MGLGVATGAAAVALSTGAVVGWWLGRARSAAARTGYPHALLADGKRRPLSALELGLAAAANRLNNRLAAIMGYLELVERAQTLDVRTLNTVRAETREAADIVRDLMGLVQLSDPGGKTAHLETALLALFEQRREELAEGGVELVIEVAPAVSLVSGRQADLISLFSWLLTFAEVRLKDVASPRRVHWSATVLGAGVVVTQVDNGPRLPPGHIPQQLDYFRPADPNFLGHVELALAQRVAENCGAGLRIEATPGGEAEVTVTLIPGSLLDAPLRTPRHDAQPAAMRLEILVADDDGANRDAIQRLLELEGHHVTLAADGVEALARLERDAFDVVIADLHMPRLGGRGLYEQVLGGRPDLARRFVFVTGDDTRRASREFLSRVRQPTLAKPYLIADLIAAVNEVAAQ